MAFQSKIDDKSIAFGHNILLIASICKSLIKLYVAFNCTRSLAGPYRSFFTMDALVFYLSSVFPKVSSKVIFKSKTLFTLAASIRFPSSMFYQMDDNNAIL